MTIELHNELENKLDFVWQMEKSDLNSAVIYEESSMKTQILETRLRIQMNDMHKSINIIELALTKFHAKIDGDIERSNKDLNSVMKVFTFLMISCAPPTIIGGLWGMNLTGPMNSSETLWPFFGLVTLSILISACFYAYFRSLKYI